MLVDASTAARGRLPRAARAPCSMVVAAGPHGSALQIVRSTWVCTPVPSAAAPRYICGHGHRTGHRVNTSAARASCPTRRSSGQSCRRRAPASQPLSFINRHTATRAT